MNKKIVNKFIDLIREDLPQSIINIINAKNKTQSYYMLCASHEYIDTNMYLLEAIRTYYPKIKIESKQFEQLFSECFEIARNNQFNKVK